MTRPSAGASPSDDAGAPRAPATVSDPLPAKEGRDSDKPSARDRSDEPGDTPDGTAEPPDRPRDDTGDESRPPPDDDGGSSPASVPDEHATPDGGEGRASPEPTHETDRGDPTSASPMLGPLADAVAVLERHGARVVGRGTVRDALRGTVLSIQFSTLPLDVAIYVLDGVAERGFRIVLAPNPGGGWALEGWPTGIGDVRSALLVADLSGVRLSGKFRRGETKETIAAQVGIRADASFVTPAAMAQALHLLGYRARFALDPNRRLVVRVEPGRYIRRIRVRGETPLPERRVRRALSLVARPGSVALGQCVEPKALRNPPRPPACADDDLACLVWEQTELERLRKFLFDEGFLHADVRLGFACGRAPDEADLWVMLDLGPPYRLRSSDVKVRGNLGPRDARWVARLFRPTISPFLPIPRRVRREDIEGAVELVERELAEPVTRRFGTGGAARRGLRFPYPSARVRTNYETFSPRKPPKGRPPLEVDVRLGRAVRVDILGNENISDRRLLEQMQLFERREPPTQAALEREAENLRVYYQSRGFPLARVEGTIPDFGAEGPVRVVFRIDEGPPGRIARLEVQIPSEIPEKVRHRVTRAFSRKRALKRLGRFDDPIARSDLATIASLLHDEGYLCARAHIEVGFWPDAWNENAVAHLTLDTRSQTPGRPAWIERALDPRGLDALRRTSRLKLYVRLVVEPGPRVVTSPHERLTYLAEPIPPTGNLEGVPTATGGRWGLPRMMRKTPLRRRGDERVGGIPLRPGLARDTALAIVRAYRRSGFPVADANVRFVAPGKGGAVARAERLDRLVESSSICRPGSGVALVDTEVAVYEGRPGVFGTTLLRGNFKTRPYVLRREIAWKEGAPYDVARVEKAARNLDATGVTDGVDIRARPDGCDADDDPDAECRVHHVVTIRESKDVFMRPSFGVGLATLDPLYVFVRPVLPNLFGTGWDLSLEGHWGFNVFRSLCSGQSCYERSAQASLVRRHWFATPLSFSTTAHVQQRVTPARGRISSVLSDTQIQWPIDRHWQIYGGYLFQVANISKDLVRTAFGAGTGCGASGTDPCPVVDRGQAVVPDHTGAFQTGVRLTRIDNAFNPHDGFMASVDAMLASPYLGGWDWWLKFDLSWQHFIPIPRTDDRLDVRYSLRYGHAIVLPSAPGASTRSIPEVWRYFGGGTQDLGLRGIEPQTMLVDIEEVTDAFGFVRLRPRAVGGHIRLLGTIALQVVSVHDLFGGSLAHSLFFDFGILTQRWRQVRFSRDFRRSVGINLIKYDIRLVTVALGYAVLIPNAIWPGNVRSTDDPNGRFVFNVGVTF